MKGLKKFKEDNFASDFAMGSVLGIVEHAYRKIEKTSENDLPPAIKEKLSDLEKLKEGIGLFYKNQEEFYMNADLPKIAESTGRSVEFISNETLVPPEVVQSCIFEGKPFPDNNTKDNLLDYFMFLDSLVKQDDIEEIPKTDTPTPIIPSEEECSPDVTEKDSEIVSLSNQVDWYEQIIDSFIRLIEIAHKSN